MRKAALLALLLGLLSLLALGCGSAGDDFQAGNRLKILKIADPSGSTAPVLLAVEETDDSGRDGDAATDDEGEGDGLPDDGEAVLTAIGPNLGVLTLENEPRLGVSPGVDLQVYLVDVRYLDAQGREWAFAPPLRQQTSLNLATTATGELEFVLVPEAMKKAPGGLRDIFLGRVPGVAAAEVANLTAVIDVYARDAKNKDEVHAQGSITLTFINPMQSAKP